MKKKLLIAFSAILLLCSLPVTGNAAAKQRFSDVPDTKYFAQAVNELAERNIIGGYPDGTFKPGNPITRGQAAAIIAKLTNMDLANVKNPNFKDVTESNGYYKAIAALAEANIIGGYADGRYGPNDPIKRGQLASILVKAFDLPRYSFYDMKNPFKDVVEYESHGSSVLILYRLGIAGGTSPDRFSINAPVTRGQASKMMKGTEELKPSMVSLDAKEFGMDGITSVIWKSEQNLYEAIVVHGQAGVSDRLQLIPLKEGTETLNLGGHMGNPPIANKDYVYKKYYVHVKKMNGELTLTLEETNDYLPTEASLAVYAGEKIETISLTTLDGTLLNATAPFKQCERTQNVCMTIDKPGSYIAKARFTGGKEVQYAIEAKEPKENYFHYDIDTLREQTSYVFDTESLFDHNDYYDKEAAQNIGKHKIVTNNANEIAEIVRDPGTNIFRVKAKKVGTVEVEFEKGVYWMDGQPGDAISGITTGMKITVKDMNGLINISVLPIYTINSDM
ncbi:S-layer homology domain-containing protein [Sporosarcina cyprini]|uniref:S-layer homology domain-containing protein n=1 Tax=Sporosarcina cyprini TaxID=2910523 RepID=UPI001EDDA328|nr:S-layer homology domain-containing protein [Sporosarcina cyprini]MCG3088403.1 S-layer homology domain-containing protein [Sporosarcina cyprini]